MEYWYIGLFLALVCFFMFQTACALPDENIDTTALLGTRQMRLTCFKKRWSAWGCVKGYAAAMGLLIGAHVNFAKG